MDTPTFLQKLNKVQSGFRVEFNRAVSPYDKDFPITGLYYQGQYVMGLPVKHVPDYSLFGVDTDKLTKAGERGLPSGNSGDYIDSDRLGKIREKNPDSISEVILARGYQYLLSNLVNRKLIDQRRAEKVFRCVLYPKKPDHVWPKRFIALGFNKEI